MKKSLLVTVLLLVALLLATIPAGAASWTNKVTGGGQAKAGSVHFSVNVSAKEDSEGNASGQLQYSRSGQSVADLSMHAKVKCMGVFSGGVAVAAGPAKPQDDTSGGFSGKWMVVEVLEGGKGSGDRIRVRLLPQSDAENACGTPSGTFPGILYDGNFNIRTK